MPQLCSLFLQIKRTSYILIGLFILLFLTGCGQYKTTTTLNPDGSGKVEFEMIVADSYHYGYPDNSLTVQQIIKSVSESRLFSSEGIETWKNLKTEYTKDFKVKISGVAYFKDFEKIKLFNIESDIHRSIKKNKESTRYSLEYKQRWHTPLEKPYSKEELDQKWNLYAKSLKQNLIYLENQYKNFNYTQVIHFPGPIKTHHPAIKVNGHQATFVIDGPVLLPTVKKLLSKEDYVKKLTQTRHHLFPNQNPKIFLQALYQNPSLPYIEIQGPYRQLFDYQSEVNVAKKLLDLNLQEQSLSMEAYTQEYDYLEEEAFFVQESKLDSPKEDEQAQGEPFESLKVVGMQIRKAIPELEYQPRVELSVLGTFPSPIFRMARGHLTKVIDDLDQNIIQKSSYSNTFYYGNLSEDKKSIMFEIEIPVQSIPKLFKSVEGIFVYKIHTGLMDVELGTMEFKKGSYGKLIGATIKKVDSSKKSITIELSLRSESFINLQFYNDQEDLFQTKLSSESSNGNKISRTYTFKQDLPSNARVVLTKYNRMKTYKIPFKIEDIPLPDFFNDTKVTP